MNRHYFVGHSYMGVNYTYDSPCWSLHVFSSQQEREDFLKEHEYKDGNRVCMKVSAKIAAKIVCHNFIKDLRSGMHYDKLMLNYNRVVIH